MNSYLNKSEKSSTISDTKKGKPTVQFKDNRSSSKKHDHLQNDIDTSTKVVAQKAKIDRITDTPIQRQENRTGLPDQLKTGIENLSGIDMSATRVHYNSSEPAQLQAHAFAQGNNIHIAPGQEQHLPHEAWHVVQQKQGRVQPTKQLKTTTLINDDEGLEREADIMGAKALQSSNVNNKGTSLKNVTTNGPVQRYAISGNYKVADDTSFALNTNIGALYATRKQIDNSNNMLRLSGGKGSLVHLRQGPQRDIENVSMNRVDPELDLDALGRQDRYSKHKALIDENQISFQLWRDCERASEAVTGTEDHLNRRTKIGSTGNDHGLTIGRSRNPVKDDTAHSLSVQVYMFNLDEFLDGKSDDNVSTYINLGGLDASYYNLDDQKANFTPIGKDPVKALEIYGRLKPVAKDEFDKTYKINEYATPEVGDSFVTATERDMPGFQSQNDRTWEFHWGGVILKGGDDIATLESMADGDEFASTIDDEWYFAIQGIKKQDGNINGESFHYEHLVNQGTHGNKATTLAVTNADTPTVARNFIKADTVNIPEMTRWIVEMEASDDTFQDYKAGWDYQYTIRLQSVQNFIDSNSLKDFQKQVFRDIKIKLEDLKVRRDALNPQLLQFLPPPPPEQDSDNEAAVEDALDQLQD